MCQDNQEITNTDRAQFLALLSVVRTAANNARMIQTSNSVLDDHKRNYEYVLLLLEHNIRETFMPNNA